MNKISPGCDMDVVTSVNPNIFTSEGYLCEVRSAKTGRTLRTFGAGSLREAHALGLAYRRRVRSNARKRAKQQ